MNATGWEEVHAALTQLARDRAQHDWEEGRWLLRGLREAVHLHLGHGSFLEYLERLFGYGPRFAVERLRVAEALEALPETSQALRDGELSWSAIRELTRVATQQTEGEWLRFARGRTVRQIEEVVSGREPGDRPTSPSRGGVRRHFLKFEVAAETLATFREAKGRLEREVGHTLDDDTVLMMMGRLALGGPNDEGRASYQIAMTLCARCERGYQQGHGELVEVGPEIVEMASCDAQEIGNTHVGATPPETPGNPHVGAKRATQTIPPAVRRQVVRRDHGRCVVPGCRSSAYLDVHHIRPRAEGGDHEPDGLVLVCSAHHRAQHAGYLSIEGKVSTGLVFRGPDGDVYGGNVSPQAAEVRTQAFQALRHMGYRESEARRAVDAAHTHVGHGLQAVLREALGALQVREDEVRYHAAGSGTGWSPYLDAMPPPSRSLPPISAKAVRAHSAWTAFDPARSGRTIRVRRGSRAPGACAPRAARP